MAVYLLLGTLEIQTVSEWAALIDKYGPLLIVGIVLGLAFLFAASIMFRRTITASERADERREKREDAVDAERREMTEKVIDLAGSSTKAVEASTDALRAVSKEITEFRRDTHSAFCRVEEAFSNQTTLVLAKAKEASECSERLRLQNEEIGLRVAKLEGVEEERSSTSEVAFKLTD